MGFLFFLFFFTFFGKGKIAHQHKTGLSVHEEMSGNIKLSHIFGAYECFFNNLNFLLLHVFYTDWRCLTVYTPDFTFPIFFILDVEVICVTLIKLLWKNSRCPKQNFSLTQHSLGTNISEVFPFSSKVCHLHFVIFYLVNHFACFWPSCLATYL